MNEAEVKGADNKSFGMYLFFLFGQIISLLGSGIVQFVIIYWITITTGSALYLGVSATLGFGSTIVVSLFAGVFVDRWNRKYILGIVDGLEAISTLLLVYLFYTDSAKIIHVLVLLTVRGAMQGFHEPAVQAIIPVMVPKDKLSKVNSLTYLVSGVTFLIGPPAAAILIGIYGLDNMHLLLMIDVITFMIAIIPLLFISIPSVKKIKEVVEKASFKREFMEGVQVIKERPGLLSLLSAFTSANFFLTPLFVLLPLMVIESALAGDEIMLANSMFFSQLGAILISLVLMSRKLFNNNSKGVAVGLFYSSITMLLVGISGWIGDPILLYSFMFLGGIGIPIANVHSQEIWQTQVPLEFQGRVFSVRRTIAQVSAPVAMILSGIFAEMIGTVWVILIAATLEGLSILLAWFFTNLPNVEKMLEKSSKDLLTQDIVPDHQLTSSP